MIKFILVISTIFMVSCTHMVIVKDCKEVPDKDGVSVCKTLKPWE